MGFGVVRESEYMKNCSIFLGLVLLSGCAKLQWFNELNGGDRYSTGRHTYHTTESYAYDAPAAATNYDRIDNARILLVQKSIAKSGVHQASAGTPAVTRIYKQGLHWTDKKGGFYTRRDAHLKDNEGVLYTEKESVWTPLQ